MLRHEKRNKSKFQNTEHKNLTIIFLTTLMAVLGVASITPAFPSIIEHFSITPSQVTLLISAFTLPGIFLAPLVGVLADRLGRKIILLPSLFLFGIAGFLCFFTDNWQVLLLLRFVQGVGAASLGSLNITLIGDLYAAEKRGEVMGYNAAVLSIGTALYPAIGGTLTMAGWQFPFILPLIAIPTALLATVWLKNPEPKTKSLLGEYFRDTWKIINQKQVWGLFIVNTLLFVVLYGSLLSYFPQLMVERFDASAFRIGILLSGVSVVTALVASQKKRIDRLVPVKMQLQLGILFYMISMICIYFAYSQALLLAAIVIFGLGHGMLIPGIQTLLVGSTPLKNRAGFMSINSMVLRLGQTFGPLIIGVFYALKGTVFTFIGGALVAAIMFIVTAVMIRVERN